MRSSSSRARRGRLSAPRAQAMRRNSRAFLVQAGDLGGELLAVGADEAQRQAAQEEGVRRGGEAEVDEVLGGQGEAAAAERGGPARGGAPARRWRRPRRARAG
jgi:hypothetical protein